MSHHLPESIEPILLVDVQFELDDEAEEPPSAATLSAWANAAYQAYSQQVAELTIRLVGVAEMRQLNHHYREKESATNVLSFPIAADDLPSLEVPLLGDIVICHPVLIDEAKQQDKSLDDHYAHIVSHGVLHLCGYDHQTDEQANQMEGLEREILSKQGIGDPYAEA